MKISKSFTIFISLLICYSVNATETDMKYSIDCVDCTAYLGNCQVNETDWTPYKLSKHDEQLVVELGLDEEEDETLHRCILERYKINDVIETFICFWSPVIGCKAVHDANFVNKIHMHKEVCGYCSKYCICEMMYNACVRLSYSYSVVSICLAIYLLI